MERSERFLVFSKPWYSDILAGRMIVGATDAGYEVEHISVSQQNGFLNRSSLQNKRTGFIVLKRLLPQALAQKNILLF